MNEKDPDASFTQKLAGVAEDRREVRHDVDVPVTINSEHHFLAGSATNLSAGGVFIATHIAHPIGTKFNVSIHLEDGDPGVVKGTGEVRWLRSQAETGESVQGLGIRFLSIEGNGTERIMRFLERRNALMASDVGASSGERS